MNGGNENEQDRRAIEAIVQSVEDGWNRGDGAGFAAPFAAEADYVVVNGMHAKGRETIAEGHQRIFDTFYKGSRNELRVERVRFVRPDLAVAHVHAHLRVPRPEGGEGEAEARSTWVLVKEGGEWKVEAFQNTPILEEGRGRVV
jgi:uncharacterized protein (TIGR02246 family)